VIRPEAVQVLDTGGLDTGGLPATVAAVRFRGTHTTVTLDMGGGATVVASIAADRVLRVGDPAGVHLPAAACRIFREEDGDHA